MIANADLRFFLKTLCCWRYHRREQLSPEQMHVGCHKIMNDKIILGRMRLEPPDNP